jgi:ubiquinone/menaquinone biosynthesis C-methylase UbiE
MKLLLGGGSLTKPGFTNIDIRDLPGVDIVHDLMKGIPLKDNTVEIVIADNLFTELPEIAPLMEEIWRVCKPNAQVIIKVPYYMSESGFKNSFNKRFFTDATFDHFDRRNVENGTMPEYHLKCNFRIEKLYHNYYRRGTKYIPFIGFWRRCFWNLVRTIVFKLRVVK